MKGFQHCSASCVTIEVRILYIQHKLNQEVRRPGVLVPVLFVTNHVQITYLLKKKKKSLTSILNSQTYYETKIFSKKSSL